MKTNVYIDGFNFYYACFRNWFDPICHEFLASGPHKWVDLHSFAQAIVPNDYVQRVHYCSAMVKNTPSDPIKSVRQEVYFRALRSRGTKIHLGHFEERSKIGRLSGPLPCRQFPPCVRPDELREVIAREEKGSDVNLATHLLKDAFLGDFDQAIVISNDSDLASAIRVARVDAKRPVHVVSPALGIVRELGRAATSAKLLDKTLIPQCQFPDPITLPDGTVLTKPIGW